MTDDPALAVATHEGSHAAVAWILGVAPGIISIKPGRDFSGFCGRGKLGLPSSVSLEDLDKPLVLMPAKLRRGLERSICIRLAGELGEHHLLRREGFLGPNDPYGDTEEAMRIAEMASLSAHESARLELRERDGFEKTDIESARHDSYLLAGTSLAEKQLLLMEGITTEMVQTRKFRRLVEALTPALLQHRVLPGRAVKRIFIDAEEATP